LIVKETAFHLLFQIHFHLIAHLDIPLMELVLAYQFHHHQHQLLQFALSASTKMLKETVNQLILFLYQVFLYAPADMYLILTNKYVIHSSLLQ
jgi:hypothetical protein